MSDSAPKKKATDYAGIAALITAAAAAVGLLFNQAHNTDQTSMVQDSVLAVTQYRLDQVEAQCGGLEDELLKLRIELAARGGAVSAPRPPESGGGGSPAAVEVLTATPAMGPSEGLLHDVVKKVREKRSVGGDELRDLVQQTGRAIDAADLRKK